MEQIAIKMGVSAPTLEDLEEVLAQLDEDFDGIVDKGEFLTLFMHVVGNMLESEDDLQEKIKMKNK